MASTRSDARRLKLGLTLGTLNGIGPEVSLKAIATAPDNIDFHIVSRRRALIDAAPIAGLAVRDQNGLVEIAGRTMRCTDPTSTLASNPLPLETAALRAVCELAKAGDIDAIVTGPVDKAHLRSASDDQRTPGQTELLHEQLRKDDEPPLMCFTGGPFVLGLATAHLPLREVPDAITPQLLRARLDRLEDAARAITKRAKPRIAVLGLNPHAGEGGLLGDEEENVIGPAIAAARQRGLVVDGPMPADGFFARAAHSFQESFDAVLAMSHDQGLGPYKVLAKGRGVNLTWGLTVPRTSPDHGTAHDIAGKGVADAASMVAAIELAARLARR